MRTRTRGPAIAVLAAWGLAAVTAAAHACIYTPLGARWPTGASDASSYFSYAQTARYWSVVAVRTIGGSEWDGYEYQSQAPDPGCVAGVLAGSTQSSVVDFVVGDFNRNPLGTYYFQASRTSGESMGNVEWDPTSGIRLLNTPLAIDTDGSDLARIWDVHLDAGVTYRIAFTHSGSAALKLMLFANTGGGSYWAPRSSRAFEMSPGVGFGTYTAPATGYYGVLVVNDNGQADSYQFEIGGCTTPVALTSESAVVTNTNADYRSFSQQARYWTAVGVRGSVDWDISAWGSASGANYPVCFSNQLASSSGSPPLTDFVVGDFNYNSPGTYYARSLIAGSDVASGTVEWAGTANQLAMNGPKVTRITGPDDVLAVWDVNLSAGASYTFEFERKGAGSTKLLLFRNPVAGTYWTGRASAEFTLSAATPGEPVAKSYTAPSGGWYGVVVVNDDGGSGSYDVAVSTCVPAVALSPNTVVSTPLRWLDCQFTQTLGDWAVVGVRGDSPATDWSFFVPSSRSSDCTMSGLLAYADVTPPKMDFVIGDFNHNAPGTYWGEAYMSWEAPQSGNGFLVWDPTEGTLSVNGPLTDHAAGPGDFLRVWDVYLQAGTQYHITFLPCSAGNHLLLFGNPSGGTFWGSRGDAALELSASADYTAPSTGFYGVVVVSDDAVTGTYSLGIGTCATPTALAAGAVTNTSYAQNYFSFSQAQAYWTAVGVRGTADWDLGVYEYAGGAAYPDCLEGSFANSILSPPAVDFAVGDFNYNPSGTYYAWAHMYQGRGSGTASVEWAGGAHLLNPGDPATQRVTGPGDVLECWDSYLVGGHAYRFVLTHSGSADLKLCVFRNPGGTYWTGRTNALLETGVTADFTTPPGTPRYYGLVVVNDNGLSDTYTVQVQDLGTVAVDAPLAPEVTRLGGIQPNPAREGMQIHFALHEPVPVRFEVLDVAGRRVASLPQREWGPGVWSAAWDGTGGDGARLRPGIYFVRMWAGTQMAGSARVVLLE